jgi:hypothetical protein
MVIPAKKQNLTNREDAKDAKKLFRSIFLCELSVFAVSNSFLPLRLSAGWNDWAVFRRKEALE